VVSLMGTNAGGHLGWIQKRCAICNRKLIVGKDRVYQCPRCVKLGIPAYFCEADYRVVHGRCPYCRTELKPIV